MPRQRLVKDTADMPKSKKKDLQRPVVKPTKKRLRLQSSSDEDYEPPAAASQSSSKQGTSSRGPLAPRPSGSQNIKKAKKDREDRGEKEKKEKKIQFKDWGIRLFVQLITVSKRFKNNIFKALNRKTQLANIFQAIVIW